MSANSSLPFLELPESRRLFPADGSGRSDKADSASEPPPLAASQPSPSPRRRALPRTVLRPRPLVPTSLDEALQLGRAVVAARLAPRGMETPEACMIAILHGLEVGLSPMQALQRIAVVNGRPTIWGDGALALVQASGLATFVSEVVVGDTPELWVASCTVLRRGERQVVTRTFSVEDAKRARLWGKAGPWSEYPQRMLQMRARAFALRDVFADVLGGLYLQEELADCEETPTWQPMVALGPESVAKADHGAEVVQTGPSQEPQHAHPAARPQASGAPTSPSERRVRGTAPPPPWITAAGDASAGNCSAEEVSPMQALTSEGTAAEPPSERAHESALPAPRPRSMDLRVRRPSATASRRRFNEYWEVRRPRALGEGKARSSAAKRKPDLAARAPNNGLPGQPEGAGDENPPTPYHVPGQDDLTLLDDALCCAFDPATLDEIVVEFAARISRLSSEDGRKAEAIIRRHSARLEPLASGADMRERGHE